MNTDKRVLGRRGARELTPVEVDHVVGGIHTLTLCTGPEPPFTTADGDAGECGGQP
jgi:hypothetical protein